MQKDKQLYFNYDIKSFLDYKLNRKTGEKAETMQDIESAIFDCLDYYDIDKSTVKEYRAEAVEYLSQTLKSELAKTKKISLDDFESEIDGDILRATGDAYRGSYTSEWLAKAYALLTESITKTAVDATGEAYPTIEILAGDKWLQMPEKITPDIWEAKRVRFYTTKERINALNDLSTMIDNAQDLADELTAYQSGDLDPYKISDNQYENIDYRGYMGDTSDWLTYFKENEESSQIIKRAIEAELAKHDNKTTLDALITEQTAIIRQIVAEYSSDKDYNSQILRQIGGIEATTKKHI